MLKYHIQTVELASAQKSISFNSIPQDFTDLVIYYSLRDTGTNGPYRVHETALSFNGSSSGFSSKGLGAEVPSTFSFPVTNFGGWHPDAASTANTFGNNVLYIPNYTAATNKSYSIDQVAENNETKTFFSIVAGLWSNTSPITSVTFTCQGTNLAAGSSISLYGVRRGSDGSTEVASGGVVTTSGGYTIHTFNSSGTFAPKRSLDVEYLVVAGGGAGAASNAGGGAAGGYRSSVFGEASGGGSSAESKISLSAGSSYQVTVGAGGVYTSGLDINTPGSNSTMYNITAIGGGGGAYYNGGSGGSGGGAGGQGASSAGGTGISSQGFSGGNSVGPNGGGAGGGGAAASGQNSTSVVGGNGGDGVYSSITGSSVARAGGGGGGGDNEGGARGLGGVGGGGNGGQGMTTYLPTPGTANTGGGGGGGAGQSGVGNQAGASGGSGVVIIRYLTP
jgi:hypothetical protein